MALVSSLMEWRVVWLTGMILVMQTGSTGLAGRTQWPQHQLSPLNFPRFVDFPACDSTSWTYLVYTRRCCSVRWYFLSQKMASTLLGRLSMNPAWRRGRACAIERFGSRLTLRDTWVKMWRANFNTMAGGCWSVKWNLKQVSASFSASVVLLISHLDVQLVRSVVQSYCHRYVLRLLSRSVTHSAAARSVGRLVGSVGGSWSVFTESVVTSISHLVRLFRGVTTLTRPFSGIWRFCRESRESGIFLGDMT